MAERAPWLIIVTGRPAAGKSTLAKWLGGELSLPVLSKDGVKEILFDELGWHDRERSRELGRASVAVLFHFAEQLLAAGQSLILDNTFHTDLASSRFRFFTLNYQARPVQIVCSADSEALFERFRQRALSGARHGGHVDMQCLDEYRQTLQSNPNHRLDIGGHVIEVDTSDWSEVRYEDILARVKSILMSDETEPRPSVFSG